LNNRHYNSTVCKQGAARAQQRQAELKALEADTTTFSINNTPIEKVRTFLYLGRIIAYNNSDWATLYCNLKKAQKRWAMVVRILDKEGASPRAKGFFYKTIVQAVLLYSCETWTLTSTMLKVLDAFHHRVARRITGRIPHKQADGTWHYPPLDKAMKEAGLHSMEHYIAVQQNRMAHHIASRAIYTQCVASQPRRGSAPNISRYWKQHWELDPPSDGDDSDYEPDTDNLLNESTDDDDIDDDNLSSTASNGDGSSDTTLSSS
jgi:hypothetical protein